ncbi:hypothetical protein BIT28_08790 [Photobacterium proteolyticum]|uniref:Phosphate ABC transporter substrate-binding protein n=1 Tax=Photobacterium proteolyticum TaxID=1903952 RepID=A0A1Q9GII0_9GAMM|nr:hypothetical protein [Photobacterium proteolyticum]OLQ74266.1 hypothetical protein BIT28_08790 [Photobacterium proteolyticum]
MCNGLNTKSFISLLAAGIMFLLPSFSSFASDSNAKDVEFAVFSLNDEIPSLSKSKARMLYKGRTKKLNGSIKIVLVDLPTTSILREDFYNMLLGKSISQMNGYWASLSFSGKGTPPEELNSDDIKDIIEWLNRNPNGIAYAPVSEVPENANILITILQGE